MDIKRIKSKLNSLGISQRKLAEKLGVHYSFLNAVLNDRYRHRDNHLKNRISNFVEVIEKYFPENIKVEKKINKAKKLKK